MKKRFGPVNASYSLPKCQAVKLTFLAPCSAINVDANTYFYNSIVKYWTKKMEIDGQTEGKTDEMTDGVTFNALKINFGQKFE